MWLFLFCLAVYCLFFPSSAFAWGPGAHMVTGNWLLQNLAQLPVSVAASLMLAPGQFLHGCLSADIFIGKGSKAKKGHSHNWESGFSLLSRADGAQERAYAYGYLAHLAADTVAHNVFVPVLFHTAPGKGRLSHVYLEVQADRLLAWDSADALGVFQEKDSSKTAAMLRSTMRQRPLPFWIKSHLFRGGIALGGSKLWRGSMCLLDRNAPEDERGPLLQRMLSLSTRAIVDVLRHGEDSRVLALDPIGADALSLAEEKRRAVKHPDDGESGLFSPTGVWFGPAASPARDGFPSFSDNPSATRQNTLRLDLPEVLASLPPVCQPDTSSRQ